ncbi:alpha/beta fold hydrolase [Celerinatantimonas sp. YJH-8]
MALAHAASRDYQTEGLTSDALPVYYQQLKAQMTYDDSWLSGHFHNFHLWQVMARHKLRAALLTPDSHRAFEPEVIDVEDRGSYVAEKVAFNVTDESRILGLLLLPKSEGRHAGVILLHDHGAKFDIGKEKMVRPFAGDTQRLASAQAWSERFFTGHFVGDELASRGYVVFVTDALGWGDRGPMTYAQQQALASNFFNLGRSLAGEMAYEDMRSFEFLQSLPQVDKHRVGIVGFSMGGFRAWQLAALEPSEVATAVISWIGTYQGLMVPGNNQLRGQSAFYMMHPGLAKHMDFPDIASISAPKPMLFFNGEKDTLFPEDAVQDAYNALHQVWQSQHGDHDERLVTRLWPELGHVFYWQQQQVVYPWLAKWLQPELLN